MFDIFTTKQWDHIQTLYENWWRGNDERPIFHLCFSEENPSMPKPHDLITEMLFLYGPDTPAEKVVEIIEYIWRSRRYEFGGFPHTYLNLGPVHCVEYIGCEATISPSTVWFKARREVPADQRVIARDAESVFLPWENRLRSAMEARFGGGYVLSTPTAGGMALDIIAEFYGHEALSYLLYDDPESVLRLMREATDVLREIGKEQLKLTPNARAYTSWGGLYSPIPWITMQCDYCAMIGPEHFDRFVLPDIRENAALSPLYNYYHLDGEGEVIHLDKLLAIPELRCVQYMPSPGSTVDLELSVYERIQRSGKNVWIAGPIERVREVAERTGTARGLYWFGGFGMDSYDKVMRYADDLTNGH